PTRIRVKGKNGSGKSTLLRALLGIVSADLHITGSLSLTARAAYLDQNYELLNNAESVLGPLIKGQRDNIVLTTKFGFPFDGGAPDNSRGFILRQLEGSLERLGTDWVDIYMIHIPDEGTPLDETLRALDDIVTSGKARYIAVSNMAPWRVVEADWVAKELRTHGFICSQNEYSLLQREPEKELIPALSHRGMTLNPYFPLASGMLTGKYLEGGEGRLKDNFLGLGNMFLTERNHAIVRRLDTYAKERGHSLIELAMSWLACQPAVAGIIAGATKPEQVAQNVMAASWKMSADELSEIAAITA
ncbi:MAG: aldo/keto reductase, partial [Sphingomonadales bacterium]